MAFVRYLRLKQVSIYISLMCFDRNFDRPHINVVTFVQGELSHIFSTET